MFKQEEVRKDGAPPIEFVDGDDMVTLIENLEFGLRPRKTFDVDGRLFRSELKEVSGLENLSILKQPQGTNFPVTDEEWKIISNLMKEQID